MKKKSNLRLTFFLSIFVFSVISVNAQLIIGQYEDEAPFRTWNSFGIQSASAVGRGETQFALVADSSAAVINPARLTGLPKFSFTLNGSYTSASFDKYAIVNTGVLISEGNSSVGIYALDFAGIAFTHKGWAFGISAGLLENYERPEQNADYEYRGTIQYLFEFAQSGLIKNFNISIARKIGQWASIGIGMNYILGTLEKTIVENLYYNGVTISDTKSHDFKGFYLNGGLTADVTQELTIAAVFRTPYTKDADSKSSLHYDSPQGSTDIKIEAAAKNGYKQPLVLGIGLDYRFSPQLRIAADASFFNWASYSITYFDEIITRDFKNIIKVGGGVEYMGSIHIFQQDIQIPLRGGISYDPQPIKQPQTHYVYYTLGTGMHWQRLHLDAGAMFGNEKGSGHNLYGRKFSITLSYLL